MIKHLFTKIGKLLQQPFKQKGFQIKGTKMHIRIHMQMLDYYEVKYKVNDIFSNLLIYEMSLIHTFFFLLLKIIYY